MTGGADRVGAVPYRHLGSQFRGVDPVGEDPCAGRVAHALEILVEDDDHAHDPHEGLDQFRAVLDARDPGAEVGAEAEGEVGGGAQQQAQGHDDASPDAVYHIAVDEAREAVDERPGEDDPSEIRVRDPVFGREPRHGQREVLAHEVEQGVTGHGDQDCPDLPRHEPFAVGPQRSVCVCFFHGVMGL